MVFPIKTFKSLGHGFLVMVFYLRSCHGNITSTAGVNADCTQLRVTGLSPTASTWLVSSNFLFELTDRGWVNLAEGKRDTIYLFQMSDETWIMGKDTPDPTTGRLLSRLGIKAWSVADSESQQMPDLNATFKGPIGWPPSSGWRSRYDSQSTVIEEYGVQFICSCRGVSSEQCRTQNIVAVTTSAVIAVCGWLFCLGCIIVSFKHIRKFCKLGRAPSRGPGSPTSAAAPSSSSSSSSREDRRTSMARNAVKTTAKQRAEEAIKVIESAGEFHPSVSIFPHPCSCFSNKGATRGKQDFFCPNRAAALFDKPQIKAS